MSINYIDMLLLSLSDRLNLCFSPTQRQDLGMIGIHTGGVWVAERLHHLLKLPQPLGQLNIAFYRDDFTRIGLHPHVTPTTLPFSVENRPIILVDDVIYSGRTIRAALNEIFDYGRPASISLAVLIDRNGRELPIQPDFIGCSLALASNKHIKLCGPHPLFLDIRTLHNEHDTT